MTKRLLDDQIVTTAQLCEALGIGRTALSDLKAKRVIEPVKRNQWLLWPSLRAALAHYREMAAGRGDGGLDLIAERARLAKAQADAQEMKNEVTVSNLLDAEEVLRTWEGFIFNARARLLAMPSKLTPVMASETDHRRINAHIQDEIYAALQELADHDYTKDDHDAGTDESKAREDSGQTG